MRVASSHGISFGFLARHWQQIEAGRPIAVTTPLRISDTFSIPIDRLLRRLDADGAAFLDIPKDAATKYHSEKTILGLACIIDPERNLITLCVACDARVPGGTKTWN
jgi:hypothetical protein